jgi:endonuclease/exonuclease/phosphatase (EEP) superfamily protein YafD
MSHVPVQPLTRGAPYLAALALSACVTLTELPRGVSSTDDGALRVAAIACDALTEPRPAVGTRGLDPDALRIMTWNLHKQEDAGWERDLQRFLAGADVALLQEAVLREDLRAILAARGLRYTMASAFIYREVDYGVVTAATMPPLALCADRAVEPLFGIPKAGIVAWYALEGRTDTLAVVNIHAVNFTPSIASYQAQLTALLRPLAAHDGPIVFAGDFNTWSDARREALRASAAALGLTEIVLEPDLRARFFGQQLDHVLTRGLTRVSATAIAVASSDHNPVIVTLRVAAH